jgi:predicted AAA+ superfamily ATPase
MIERRLRSDLSRSLGLFPAVALLGARQVGKTTLARQIAGADRSSIYLDLERPSDLAKLADAELFLAHAADRLVILDEVQRMPELFSILRAVIDSDRRPGRFLLLGSAAPELLRQTAESLAGRIALHELAPFDIAEVGADQFRVAGHWLRGGFPPSWLASDDEASFAWREAFVATHLERDIPAFGIRVPGPVLRRFWMMLAHSHGQLWNASRVASSMGVSAPAVQRYLDILEGTYMVRRLSPLTANLGKRLVKSPKVFLRDSGLLHALLGIRTADDMYGHPIAGPSWEGWVVEQVASLLPSGWQLSFFRTAAGAEMDLVAEFGRRRLAFEIKFSSAPSLSKGFWNAVEDLAPEHVGVVAPVESSYPIGRSVDVIAAHELPKRLAAWVGDKPQVG